MYRRNVVLRAPRPGVFWMGLLLLLIVAGVWFAPAFGLAPVAWLQNAWAALVPAAVDLPAAGAGGAVPASAPPEASPPAGAPAADEPLAESLAQTPVPGQPSEEEAARLIREYHAAAFALYDRSTPEAIAALQRLAGGQALASVLERARVLREAGSRETLLDFAIPALEISHGDGVEVAADETWRVQITSSDGSQGVVTIPSGRSHYLLAQVGDRWVIQSAKMTGLPGE